MRLFLFMALIALMMAPMAFASITNYRVSNPVPLGSNITVSGQLDSNANNIECIFLVHDINGEFIKRLTGEFTENGFFSTDYFVVTEPPFAIDQNYNFTTKCLNDTNVATFTIAKPNPIIGTAANLIIWVKDNFLAAMIILCGIVSLFGLVYWAIRGRL